MGLRDDIQSALTEAFDGDLADVISQFTLITVTQGVYSPSTGQYEITETRHLSRGVFETIREGAISPDSKIKTGDITLTINAIDIDVDPKADDVIELTTGVEYIVIAANKVMAGNTEPIIYELTLRKAAA